MLTTIAVVLIILWLLGFLGHVAGNIIHIVLVVAAILFIYDFVIRRRRPVE